jgi:hypothetical protein
MSEPQWTTISGTPEAWLELGKRLEAGIRRDRRNRKLRRLRRLAADLAELARMKKRRAEAR